MKWQLGFGILDSGWRDSALAARQAQDPRPRPRRRDAAFTLMEMVVVVVILALMAAMLVPQLTGNERRAFRVAVDQTADLLTMYAQRESLDQKVVGIFHDRERNWLMLMHVDIDPSNVAATPQWLDDPLVEPVKLPHFMSDTDVEFFADGERYDASEWPLFNDVGQDRPYIDIVLRGAGEEATLSLSPHGVAPAVISATGSTGFVRTRIDLDASGRIRETW